VAPLGAAVALLFASFHIIAYHDVDAEPRSGWAMRTEMFVDQMELLAATEQNVVPLADVNDYLAGRCQALPPRAVVLTVDDGFTCAYTDIAPVLGRLGYPFTIFIYPSLIGSGEHSLTWAQVAELQRRGADVESHTMTHPHLMRRSHPEMSDAVYAAWLHDELARARAVVEARTKQPVRFLAYPYGDYDAAVEREATSDGYLLALTSESGPNTLTTDPLTLRRFAPDAATTLEQFAAGIGLGKLELSDVAPADGVAASTFTATIADRRQFDPASVHVVLLGDPRTRGAYDPQSGRVSLSLPAHPKPRQRVVVWADDAATGQRFAAIATLYASSAERDRYRAIHEKLAALPLHHDAK